MRRALLVFGSLERAGAQLRTLEVCQALQDRYAVQFDVCSLGLGPNHLKGELDSIVSGAYEVSIKSARFTRDFLRLLQRRRYAAVNVLARLPSPYLLWLARLCGVETRIASMRNAIGQNERGLGNVLGRTWFRWMLKQQATDVVGVSHSTLEAVFPERWRSGGRFHVIYNGFELARLARDGSARGATRASVRQEFGWPTESRIIINVGRLVTQKNHETIIATTRRAYDADHRLRLLLVGDGRRREQIRHWLADQQMEHVTALAGVRTDVPRLLQASDVFFFPSRWEGLPGALIEAIGAGLPVVASDIAQIAEVGQYFPGALRLAPAEDATQHATHLLEALDGTHDCARQWAQFAQSPFDMDKCVRAYAAVYGCGE